jgi:pyridoxal biosynthesis lyase PdxS
VLFAAGGIATPADAALMMQMGMDGVFVGSGIVRIPATDDLDVTLTCVRGAVQVW